jgi:hypothetical protein
MKIQNHSLTPDPCEVHPRRRKLSGDHANRLAEIRRLHAHSKALATLFNNGKDDEDVEDALNEFDVSVGASSPKGEGTHQLYRVPELESELAWARSLSGESRKVVLRQLEQARDLGPMRHIAAAPDPSALEGLRYDFPNFNYVLEFIERRLLLCRLGPAKLLRLPPLLLSGPPGVGKTWFTKRLAQIMADIPYAQADLSQSTPAFAITGLDAAYETGRPGLIWRTLQSPCASPIVMFDEIDKVPSAGVKAGQDSCSDCLKNHQQPDFKMPQCDCPSMLLECCGLPLAMNCRYWTVLCCHAFESLRLLHPLQPKCARW